jgi:hypothetical protein
MEGTMRVTCLITKDIQSPAATQDSTLIPGFPDQGMARPQIVSDGSSASLPGLSWPDPLHPRFTAISWVVLQEVKSDAAMALLRLELLRRQHQEPAIARAIEFLRCAVGELDALARGESDS